MTDPSPRRRALLGAVAMCVAVCLGGGVLIVWLSALAYPAGGPWAIVAVHVVGIVGLGGRAAAPVLRHIRRWTP
jgi:hypothetical protein